MLSYVVHRKRYISSRGFTSVALLLTILMCFIYYTLVSESTQTIPKLISANFMKILGLHETDTESLNTAVSSRQIHIHYYNPPQHSKRREDIFLECPTNCSISYGEVPDYYDKDVVIFYGYSLGKTPVKKRPGQIWVFDNKEPMWQTSNHFRAWNGLFNWTMTYRRDSDIPRIYGRFDTISDSQPVHFPKLTSKFSSALNPKRSLKTGKKFASTAWFVSHCHTHGKREDYVKILTKSHAVDIYGKCGTRTCAKKDAKCFAMLSEKYKFYLAFENTLYKDYITEKSFRLYSYNVDVIPVTRGFPNTHSMYLPTGSYIDANRFKGIEQLGHFLNVLGKNRARYLPYFQWRNNYHARSHQTYWCDLCDRLHEPNVNTKYQRIYHDLYKWMYGSSESPTLLTPNDIRN